MAALILQPSASSSSFIIFFPPALSIPAGCCNTLECAASEVFYSMWKSTSTSSSLSTCHYFPIELRQRVYTYTGRERETRERRASQFHVCGGICLAGAVLAILTVNITMSTLLLCGQPSKSTRVIWLCLISVAGAFFI